MAEQQDKPQKATARASDGVVAADSCRVPVCDLHHSSVQISGYSMRQPNGGSEHKTRGETHGSKSVSDVGKINDFLP